MQSRLEGIMSQFFNDEKNDDVTEETDDENINSRANNNNYLLRRMMNRVTLGTFHHVCVRILRQYAEELCELPNIRGSKLDGKFTIIDQNEQISILKQCLKDCNLDLKDFNLKPKQLLNILSRLKLESSTSQKQEQNQRQQGGTNKKKEQKDEMTKKVFQAYCSKLLENNCVDFDDLILYTRDLLHHNADVRGQLRQRWTHILIDEFQDTSQVQLDLIKALTTTSLFVVGDSDQSIYSWRGADVNSMNHFVNQFLSLDVEEEVPIQTVKLMENYRSNLHIVKAAQRVISHNKALDRNDMIPMRGAGPKPQIFACKDSEAEAEFIVRNIKQNEEEKKFTPSTSIAVLYRLNAQSRAIEEECVSQNLRYIVRGSAGKFYNRAEVKDCLCFLRLIYNGQDKVSFIRATKVPHRGIGEVAINEFFNYYESVVLPFNNDSHTKQEPNVKITTYLDVLLSLSNIYDGGMNDAIHAKNTSSCHYPSPQGLISKRALSRLVPFARDMKMISELATNQTVSELLSSIIDRFKLKEHFLSSSESDKWENVMELVNAASRFNLGPSMISLDVEGGENNTPLGTFLDDISLLSDIMGDDDNKDNSDDTNSKPANNRVTVNLMTIHASKGMEFDVVFVIGNEEGTFPTQRALQSQRAVKSQNAQIETSVELEEERRLMYVAMTRAMNILILTWRRSVDIWFEDKMMSRDSDRSRFLDAILKKKSDPSNSSSSFSTNVANSRSNDDHKPMPSSAIRPGNPNVSNKDSFINKNAKVSSKRMPLTPIQQKTITLAEISSSSGAKSQEQRKHISSLKNSLKGRNYSSSSEGIKLNKIGAMGDEVPECLDNSELFYPVGSKVIHKVHGEGIVVSSNDNSQSLKVSVKFDGGFDFDFPIENNGLRFKL